METNHEVFLYEVLASSKILKENSRIEHRVAIAKFETSQNFLKDLILSIESQLKTKE